MTTTALLLAVNNGSGGGSGSSGGGSGISLILPLILIVLVGYFLFVRPNKARQKKAQALRSELGVGAEVMTTAGLFGRVAQVDDESLLLEVAPGVTMRFVKAAVAKVVTPGEAPAEPMELASGDSDAADPESEPGGRTGTVEEDRPRD